MKKLLNAIMLGCMLLAFTSCGGESGSSNAVNFAQKFSYDGDEDNNSSMDEYYYDSDESDYSQQSASDYDRSGYGYGSNYGTNGYDVPSESSSSSSYYNSNSWTYGNVSFRGSQPSNCRNIGSVLVYYDGNLQARGTSGNTEIYEATGNVCVIYPRNYSGRQIEVISSGGSVQVGYQ